MLNWTKPITIDAQIVVSAPEPATTLQHLNNLDACSPCQIPDVIRCVQVHFVAEFYPSSEDDVSSRPAKSMTPSPVAAPESPFHSSRADAEIKFQVRHVEDHSPPIFLNSLQGGLHIPEALRLFLGAGSCGPKHNPFAGPSPSPLDCQGGVIHLLQPRHRDEVLLLIRCRPCVPSCR